MPPLLDYFKGQEQVMIDLLTQMINIESPTRDKAAVDHMATLIEDSFKVYGATEIQRFQQTEAGDHVFGKWQTDAPGKPIMFLGHMDTVWPLGTLAERPVMLDGEGRLYGPGAMDMKAGLVIALQAIDGLTKRGELPKRPIWFMVNTDEETGSTTSTPIIQQVAADCGLVIVLEPGTPDGAMKIQRKGSLRVRIDVAGYASHAGNHPEEGINAVIELAHQSIKLHKMNDLQNGTSVSVTVVEGGMATNVIPDKATAWVDCRMLTIQALETLKTKILGSKPVLPGAKVHVELLGSRGPMEFNDLMRASFEQCQTIGKTIGITVRGESVGGGSDGNTTAMMGIPTLDGMGAIGEGLHAINEHILISSLAQQAALNAAIIRDWQMD